MNKVDEQFEFNKLNFLWFFQNQIIHDKKNREKKNIQYTDCFKSAFNALVNKNYIEAKTACKSLRKKSLQWLLYFEFEFYCNVFKERIPSKDNIASVFGFSPKRYENFIQKVTVKLPKNRFAEQSYNEFLNFKTKEDSYKRFPVKNIAICATMSAGKSTFVNALLGKDVLPARNEGTTAKITSVYDKDGSKNLIGFVEKNSNIENLCLNANLSTINSWNNDAETNRIFLQGDLDGIGNKGLIVAVHDTPGTNNSGDKNHHKITMDFLTSQKLDALIFVANATQLKTTDEHALLKEIFEKVVKQNNLPVIFVLNKADELDSEKENISEIITEYGKYLSEIGFEIPKVFPVSSKAARILKMAMKDFGDKFTESECDAFPSIVKKFSKRLILDNSNYDNDNNVSQIAVDGETYESSLLQSALIHSGINKIEKEIELIVRR